MAFTTHADARLYWRLEGARDRPVLVLLNSIGCDLSLYDAAAPHLLTHFRLLRLDTRGHGASDAPAGDYSLDLLAADVVAVMEAAGVGRAVLVGVSLGGMIAMNVALREPERVEALVLACTSAAMDPAAWDVRIKTVREEGMAAVTDIALSRFFSERFRIRDPQTVDSVRTGLLTTRPEGYSGCAAAIRDMELLDHLSAIAAPTLVIAGARDMATPFEGHGDKIAAAISGAQTAMLDVAHLPCLEAPLAFAGVVRDFLRARGACGSVGEARDVLFEAGLQTRREVLGDAWVDESLKRRTAFTSDYQAMITRYAWNEIWGRPGLDHRTRRLLVVAICASLARWEEFRLHVRTGLEQGGFTEDELKEVLMQTAIYAGVPAANTAFTEAAEIIAERAGQGSPS